MGRDGRFCSPASRHEAEDSDARVGKDSLGSMNHDGKSLHCVPATAGLKSKSKSTDIQLAYLREGCHSRPVGR